MSKERYIWIKGENVPVSEEVYLEYYRPVWAEKKRKEREKRCRTGDGSRCTKDCESCDRKPDGGVLSLDKFFKEGYEVAASVEAEEVVMEKILLDELYAALNELTCGERSLINALYYKERPERDFAAEIGMPQTTLSYRKKRILEWLRKKLKNFR